MADRERHRDSTPAGESSPRREVRVYRSGRARRRRALLVVVLAALAAGALAAMLSRGGDSESRTAGAPAKRDETSIGGLVQPANVERFSIGSGARQALVLKPEGDDPRPGVIFLHGWGQLSPAAYGPWLRHLARRGNTVIAPRYQTGPGSPPDRFLDDAVASIRAALRRAPVERGSLVVAGHSAGGALAVDYAAVAGELGLPVPRAVFAVYPGRALKAFPGGVPAEDESKVEPDTRLVVLAGATDQVVGEGPAAQIVERADTIPAARRKLVRVTDPAVSDHYGPARSTPAARRAFWRPLDDLIELARAGG